MTKIVSSHPPVLSEVAWLTSALQAAGVGVWVWNLDDNTIFADEKWRDLFAIEGEVIAVNAENAFAHVHPDDRFALQAAVDTAVRTEAPFLAEFRVMIGDETRWIESRGDIIAATTDYGLCLAGVNSDITPKKNMQKQLEYVASEMAHRMKNMMSLVGGILRMTARTSPTKEQLTKNLISRFEALSALNDIILSRDGRTPTVKHLTMATLHAPIASGKVNITLPDFTLNRMAAQTFILALNELATNAVKYGALKDDDGHIDLQVKADADSDHFEIIWTEHAANTIVPPDGHIGFGFQVLDKMTRSTFKGAPKFEWRETGLEYSCLWSLAAMGE
ncbi:sensor histidine kinase [Robiginitomaculum antarcticum]|uniref:sensor histidine kinase n=1 Tax=Robiginitomaculum antarcticum TaxID=437507 RepID=UPI00036E82A6|nr:HWE histidine kinase domain-containing protein [Robiginitomaculum antarcticum]